MADYEHNLQEYQEQRLKDLIKKYDKNGDGKLSKEDFQRIIDEGGHTERAKHLLDAFDKADVNKNGILDANEVRALLRAARP